MEKDNILTPPLPTKKHKGRKENSLVPIRLYTDGASRGNPGMAGIGIVIHVSSDQVLKEKSYIGIATNNTAEYKALIHGLKILKEKKLARPLKIYSDSQLMVRQLNGKYKIKQPHLKRLAREVNELLHFFPSHEIIFIRREKNRHADRLANEAIDDKELK